MERVGLGWDEPKYFTQAGLSQPEAVEAFQASEAPTVPPPVGLLLSETVWSTAMESRCPILG